MVALEFALKHNLYEFKANETIHFCSYVILSFFDLFEVTFSPFFKSNLCLISLNLTILFKVSCFFSHTVTLLFILVMFTLAGITQEKLGRQGKQQSHLSMAAAMMTGAFILNT